MTAGDIYTVAGNGKQSSSGAAGLAIRAQLFSPQGIAVDRAGNLLIAIADWANDRSGVAAARTGTFYGQAMTSGDIYTIAGSAEDPDALHTYSLPGIVMYIHNPLLSA